MFTEDQIQYLYKFCVKHYVRYYDVQIELVDHLANAIEEKMQQNPKLAFEQALDDVYKGFGVMGFSTVISQKQAALQKQARYTHWKNFLRWFSPPKIAITILLYLLLITPLTFITSKIFSLLVFIYVAVICILAIAGSIILAVKYKKAKKQLLMLESSYTSFGFFAILMQLPNLYYNFFIKAFEVDFRQNLPASLILIAFCVVLLMAALAQKESFENQHKLARHLYPQAFI